ncbi:MAG: hypothetical protein JW712_04805 [Dehalococcoidales bacterium]|nr:hypothetical protein [Dehalococcoidales bacterium]
MNFSKGTVVVVSIVIISSMLIACSNNSTLPSQQTIEHALNTAKYINYTDESGFFSLSYPNAFVPLPGMDSSKSLIQGRTNGINALKVGVPPETENDLVWLMLNAKHSIDIVPPQVKISIFPISQEYSSFEQAFAWTSQNNTDERYQLLNATKTIVNGKKAFVIEDKLNVNDTWLHQLSLYMLSEKTIWRLYCWAIDDEYTQCSTDFKKIIDSFSLNNGSSYGSS